MILDLEQYTQGADRVEKREGGLSFLHRLSKNQEAHLQTISSERVTRALCPAGIRITFQGRCRSVTCRMVVERHCRSFGGWDLLCDGLLVDHLEKTGLSIGDKVTVPLAPHDQEGVHQYELWLPITLAGPVQVEVDGDGLEPVAPPKFKYLAVGDSITQGMVSNTPSGTYAALLSRYLGADFRNHAIGGHVFDVQLLGETGDWKPDFISIAYGTNDWSTGMPKDQIIASAHELIDQVVLQYPKAKVMVVTPIWRSNGAGTEDRESLAETMKPLFNLREKGITVVDGQALLPQSLRFTTDGVHPNELGMLHLAQALYRESQLMLS